MAAVRINLGTATDRQSVIVDDSKSAVEIFREHNINIANAQTSLNGAVMNATEMNNPLSSMNIADDAFLVATIKLSNATV